MRTGILIVLLAITAVCSIALAGLPKYSRCDPTIAPNDLNNQAIVLPASMVTGNRRAGTLDDPIGTLDTAGMTWYDEQQWTTCGRQIAVDREGYVHHVWTCGLNATSSSRHAYYNVWDPTTQSFITGPGMQIDAAAKAGYVNVAVNSQGFAFPSFHQTISGDTIAHTGIGYDFMARTGGFQVAVLPNLLGRKIIYPKIKCDINDDLQITATHGTPYNFGFYALGHPEISDGECNGITWPVGFVPMDTTFWLTRDIATSYRSNRVAMVWINWRSDSANWYFGKNVYLKTSDDGGTTWNDPINITKYAPIDTNCVYGGGTIEECNQDTVRPFMDVSVIFDRDDVIHVAFTVRWMGYWDETGAAGPWIHNDAVSSIWHWDENHQEFNIIAERTDGTLNHSPGQLSTQSLCHRPSLAIDTTTGNLYCSYQAFDTLQWSESGFFQGDAWVSVSTTGGRTWSAGTNVTNTNGGQDAPTGSCVSERDINLAEFVTYGTIHMQYQLDLDAGTAINSTPEGAPTNNPIIYQRIPAGQIPTRPLINPYRALRLDSTGYPFGLDTLAGISEHHTLQPGQFVLYQNYPNPFNPTTKIQYELPTAANIQLEVFDILGRTVADLSKGMQTAGVHTVTFDGKNLSSGIYYYRLKTDQSVQVQKMLLLK